MSSLAKITRKRVSRLSASAMSSATAVGILTPLASELLDRPADELGLVRCLLHAELVPVGIDPLLACEVADRACVPFGIAIALGAFRYLHRRELAERGNGVERHRVRERHLEADRSWGDLRVHAGAGAEGRFMDRELLLRPRLAWAAVGIRDDLAPGDRDAEAGLEPVDPAAVLVDDRRADAAGRGRRVHQRLAFLLRSRHRRHRSAAVRGMEVRTVGREPDRAGAHSRGDDGPHRLDLVRRRFAFVAVRPHDPQPYGGVPDVGTEVDADTVLADAPAIRRVVLPRPVDAELQRVGRHVLHEVQCAHHRIA